jgi:hypothetical protein
MHGTLGAAKTLSPGRYFLTELPVATTSPPSSCPGTSGARGSRYHSTMSLPHIPQEMNDFYQHFLLARFRPWHVFNSYILVVVPDCNFHWVPRIKRHNWGISPKALSFLKDERRTSNIERPTSNEKTNIELVRFANPPKAWKNNMVKC